MPSIVSFKNAFESTTQSSVPMSTAASILFFNLNQDKEKAAHQIIEVLLIIALGVFIILMLCAILLSFFCLTRIFSCKKNLSLSNTMKVVSCLILYSIYRSFFNFFLFMQFDSCPNIKKEPTAP
jgi:hypothetical protein